MPQRLELGGVQLREVADLLPEQPVRGARSSEVQVPVVGDLRLLAEASHTLQSRHVLGGVLERGPWFHRQGHESVAANQPLAVRVCRCCSTDRTTEFLADLRPTQKRARKAGGSIAQ